MGSRSSDPSANTRSVARDVSKDSQRTRNATYPRSSAGSQPESPPRRGCDGVIAAALGRGGRSLEGTPTSGLLPLADVGWVSGVCLSQLDREHSTFGLSADGVAASRTSRRDSVEVRAKWRDHHRRALATAWATHRERDRRGGREPVDQVARRGDWDEALSRRDCGAHAIGKPRHEIVKRSIGKRGVRLGEVLAAPEPLVYPRDRRSAADVVTKQFDSARRFLIFEVPGPVREGVP